MNIKLPNPKTDLRLILVLSAIILSDLLGKCIKTPDIETVMTFVSLVLLIIASVMFFKHKYINILTSKINPNLFPLGRNKFFKVLCNFVWIILSLTLLLSFKYSPLMDFYHYDFKRIVFVGIYLIILRRYLFHVKLQKASLKGQDRDYFSAIKILDEIISKNMYLADLYHAFLQRGFANIKLEQYDRALSDVDYMVATWNIPGDLILRSQIYESTHQLKKAIADMQEYLTNIESSSNEYFNAKKRIDTLKDKLKYQQ